MSRLVAATIALVVGVAGLALLPATAQASAAPASWWVVPTGSLGDLGWTSITTTDAGITGISDRSETNPDDSMYLRRTGGALRATRIADPQGGHVNLDDRYGVSKNGRVVYVSGELKSGTSVLYRSTDSGAHFTRIKELGPGCGIDYLTASASGSTVAYGSCGAMQYSTNGGASFATVTASGITDLRAVGANQVLMATYASGNTQLRRYDGTALSPIGAAMPGSTLFDGLAASDNGRVIVVRTNDRTVVSYNAGASWGSVTGFGPGQASGAVVSRDGSDVYLGYSYNIYRLSGTTAKLYGNIRSRLLSLPSHPTVQLIATSSTGGKLFATAYKSGYPNFQNMYLLETKYHAPKLKKGLRIIGKAQVGKRLRARKPVARAGHYTCTVSWKAGKKHVSNKTLIRVKKAWRHKLLTVKATCRSASHADFTRKKSVRVR